MVGCGPLFTGAGGDITVSGMKVAWSAQFLLHGSLLSEFEYVF